MKVIVACDSCGVEMKANAAYYVSGMPDMDYCDHCGVKIELDHERQALAAAEKNLEALGRFQLSPIKDRIKDLEAQLKQLKPKEAP